MHHGSATHRSYLLRNIHKGAAVVRSRPFFFGANLKSPNFDGSESNSQPFDTKNATIEAGSSQVSLTSLSLLKLKLVVYSIIVYMNY